MPNHTICVNKENEILLTTYSIPHRDTFNFEKPIMYRVGEHCARYANDGAHRPHAVASKCCSLPDSCSAAAGRLVVVCGCQLQHCSCRRRQVSARQIAFSTCEEVHPSHWRQLLGNRWRLIVPHSALRVPGPLRPWCRGGLPPESCAPGRLPIAPAAPLQQFLLIQAWASLRPWQSGLVKARCKLISCACTC